MSDFKQLIDGDKAKAIRPKQAEQGLTIENGAKVALQRAAHDPAGISPTDAVQLQRTIGNQAVSQLMGSGPAAPQTAQLSLKRIQSAVIQTKLEVGPAGDKYEQEADAVAGRVVSQLNAPLPAAQRQEEEEVQMQRIQRQEEEEEVQMQRIQRQEDEEEVQMQRIQRQEDEEEVQMQRIQRQEDEEEVQMKRDTLQRQGEEEEVQMQRIQRVEDDPAMLNGGQVGGDLEATIQQARGSGQTLDRSMQEGMGQAFGADFSGVRVHTDATSDSLNRSLSAKAFTTGQDVFFKSGEYNPGSPAGQQLLAHELTHVVQQNGSGVQKKQEEE